MALLIASVYAFMELRVNFPKGSEIRDGMKALHFMLGLTVLFLVIGRIAIRVLTTMPPIQPAPPAWQSILAKATHLALYALMLGMPIAGWLVLSAEGEPIPFFGLELPPLVGLNEPLADLAGELHETFGKIGYFLIGLHAFAALFHHYVMKDNSLRRITTWSRR